MIGAIQPSAARSEPAFGDSDWVAPVRSDSLGEPTDPGPRVAEKDHEPVGISILRLPFRILFIPFRLLARGLEALVSLPMLENAMSSGSGQPKGRWKFDPIVTTEPGAGFKLTRRLSPGGKSQLFGTGTIAWDEGRKAKIEYRTDVLDAPRAFQADGTYTFKLNKAFYGIGNQSNLADKSIWLGEESKMVALYHLGKPVRHELRLTGTYSQVSSRSGTGGPPGVTSIEERFTPDEVPFLVRGSRVGAFGVATDLALLDQPRAPTRGVATRLSVEQFKAADTSDLDYRRFHTEARAYLPVFAPRRVLAMRLLHDWVDTAPGSPAVPYYRLPETNDDLLFPGYRSHRFTDNHLVLGQLEYRWLLSGRVSALLSANAGEVASTASRLRFDQKHEAYGVGFRYGYSDRWCARLDVAKGSEPTQFNITLEGSF